MSRVRWWPLVLIAALFCAALFWIWVGQVWSRGEQVLSRQHQFIATYVAAILAGILGLVWVVFFSRLPWRRRLAAAAVAAAAGCALALLVRIRGVTGDLVPLLAFRWEHEVEAPLPSGAPAVVDVHKIGPLDYPQFLGRDRRGVVERVGSGERLVRDWKASPPRLLWKHAAGPGWSSFAVAGGQVVTQEQHGREELVICCELTSGKVLWFHADPARYESVLGGIGPRATPTLTEDRVYTMGATGILNCLERSSGKRIWSRDVVRENGARLPEWGKSCSPLVDGDLVIVSAGAPDGKSLVAYRRDTGEPVWAGGDDLSGYSSPVRVELAGRPQILIFNKRSIAAHDPSSGKVLWSFPWSDDQPNVAQPIALEGNLVLVSSGYGIGSKLLKIAPGAGGRLAANLVWEARTLKAKFSNFLARGGFVYGLDDGIFVCVDLRTGKRRWKRGRYGHGQMLAVEDLLLVTTDRGGVVLVDPSPEELKELARFQALEGRTWAHPALAGRFLLVRSDEETACYELPTRKQ